MPRTFPALAAPRRDGSLSPRLIERAALFPVIQAMMLRGKKNNPSMPQTSAAVGRPSLLHGVCPPFAPVEPGAEVAPISGLSDEESGEGGDGGKSSGSSGIGGRSDTEDSFVGMGGFEWTCGRYVDLGGRLASVTAALTEALMHGHRRPAGEQRAVPCRLPSDQKGFSADAHTHKPNEESGLMAPV